MYSLLSISNLKTPRIYFITLTIIIIIYAVRGQNNPLRWKNLEEDIEYIPVNKIPIDSLVDRDYHYNGYRRIRPRAAELVPPERPLMFETPEALRTYLHKLNEYFAIIGRPRYSGNYTGLNNSTNRVVENKVDKLQFNCYTFSRCRPEILKTGSWFVC
ncbi:unnamed protein product [Heterobilharzia americana]|nr:unnamed protein product [Heterobilharzia americana]